MCAMGYDYDIEKRHIKFTTTTIHSSNAEQKKGNIVHAAFITE